MLTMNAISKTYKSGRGIEGMTLSVGAGQVYGLLGPNGAGKTTLLKVIIGLLKSSGGTCINNGISAIEDPVAYKKGMVAMIGDTVLYDYLSPLAHLEMMRVHKPDMTKEEQENLLGKLGLLDYKHEKTKSFSTGMKQRLAFAMCMITSPSVLLLDEPFSGLDIEGKLLIRDCIKDLRDQGQTAVMISSHLIYDLEEVVTKVGIVKDGCLVSEGDVEAVLEDYRNLEDYFIQQTMKGMAVAS